ncbi:MAG: universal stress protein [Thermoleophilaceae bacterium]
MAAPPRRPVWRPESGFKQMLVGSTSSGLLHHADRAVVVVP